MSRRLLTAILGIPVILFFAYLGGVFWALVVGALSLACYYEFYRLAGRMEAGGGPVPGAGSHSSLQPLTTGVGLWFGLGANGALIIAASLGGEEAMLRALLLAGMACAAVPVFLSRPSPRIWAVVFWGILYTGGFLSLAIPLRALGEDWRYLLLVILLTWANDTGAFFTGRQWGRHRLALALSPGKTWEGAVGGVTACLLVALVASRFLPWAPGRLLFLATLLAAGSQVGDLVESVWKRAAGVKDAGSILAGHGGFLDRFDSFIFNVPLAFYYYRWLVH